MITRNEVKQISDRLIMENADMPNDNPGEDLSEDIFQIVFRKDEYECGDTTIIDRHIDIEYSFGEYYEVSEDTSLFQYICSLCNLSLSQEDREEVIIYQQS